MKHLHWFLCSTAMAVAAVCASAAPCNPPKQAVERLRGYLSYEAAWEHAGYGLHEFDTAVLRGGVLFRSQERSQLPPGRVVYVIQEGRRIQSMSCPDAENWVGCVRRGMPQELPSGGVSAVCSIRIDVPTWHPSADTPFKRRLAAGILSELRNSGFDPAKVVAKDFNVYDPDLWLLITDTEGNTMVQGCFLNVFGSPHCGWRLFGQAPQDRLERDVMQMPYVVFDSKQRPSRF